MPSIATAMENGMRKVDEFKDEENEVTVVYTITRGEFKIKEGNKR